MQVELSEQQFKRISSLQKIGSSFRRKLLIQKKYIAAVKYERHPVWSAHRYHFVCFICAMWFAFFYNKDLVEVYSSVSKRVQQHVEISLLEGWRGGDWGWDWSTPLYNISIVWMGVFRKIRLVKLHCARSAQKILTPGAAPGTKFRLFVKFALHHVISWMQWPQREVTRLWGFSCGDTNDNVRLCVHFFKFHYLRQSQ